MKTSYRASKIIIENLKQESIPWVHIVLNQVIKDDNGKVTNEIPRYDRISIKMTDVATRMFTFTDPVIGEEHTISGYGIEKIIEQFVIDEVENKYGTN